MSYLYIDDKKVFSYDPNNFPFRCQLHGAMNWMKRHIKNFGLEIKICIIVMHYISMKGCNGFKIANIYRKMWYEHQKFINGTTVLFKQTTLLIRKRAHIHVTGSNYKAPFIKCCMFHVKS